MGIVSLFANGKPLPMVVGMAAGALSSVALTWLTLSGQPPHTHSPVRMH
jgi:MFS transporter, DHA1 family, multidrug resistance protein